MDITRQIMRRILTEAVETGFENIHVDTIGGGATAEHKYVLVFRVDNKPVGRLDYTLHDDVIYIDWIEVSKAYRRHKIATALNVRLKTEWPGHEIKHGMTTPEGSALRQSMGEAQGIEEFPEEIDPQLQRRGHLSTVYHETNREAAEDIVSTQRLRSPHEAAVFVTSRPPDFQSYGDGTLIAFDVPTSKLHYEDQYPTGRQDYRIEFRSMESARRGIRILNPQIVPHPGADA